MEQPKRSFKPEVRAPAPRADGLRDRMRTAPPTGKPAPAVPTPPPQPIGADEAPTQPVHRPVAPMPTVHTQAHQQAAPPAPPQQIEEPPLAQTVQTTPVAIEQPSSASVPEKPATTSINVTVQVPKFKTPTFIRSGKNAIIRGANRIKSHDFKRPEIGDNQRFSRNVSIGIGIFVLLAGSWVAYSQTIGSKNPSLPAELQLKAKYSLFYPTKNKALKVDKNTFKYETGDGLVSFVSHAKNDTKVTVSQQAAPDYKVGDNVAYATLVKSLPGVTSFDSPNGKVTLTHPENKSTPGFAFLASKGTMVIIQPSKSLPDSEWKNIFNSFEVVKND